MKFTEKFIQALKQRNVRYDVREKRGEGFAIRVSTSGEKTWIYFYNFEGRKRRMTLGSYPNLSVADARKKHRAEMKKLEHGKDPGLIKKTEKQEAKNAPTVKELINEYIEKWAKPRKRTWKEDQRILFKDIEPIWGKLKAKDITKRNILLLIDTVKERGAPIAANRTLACVRRMFNFAVERDIITISPCVSVKAPSKENKRDRCLSTEEIKSFWIGLEQTGISQNSKLIVKMSNLTKLALKLQLVTAQRKGEIVTAEWIEIDSETRWWNIPAIKAKNNVAHRVYLSELALELLEEIKNLNGNSKWLFPSVNANKHITPTALARALNRSVFDDVAYFTPHDLRRTAATHMTAMGISRLVVSKILNHVDGSVTAIYDRHSYDSEKKHALEAWGQKLKEIIDDVETANNVISIKAVY